MQKTGLQKWAMAGLVALAAGAQPARAEEAAADDVVASVDGVKYLRKDVDKFIAAMMNAQNVPAGQQADFRKAYEPQIIENFISKTVLLNEAKKEGVTLTDEDRKASVERMEGMLKARNMTLEQYFKQSPLGEEAARKELEDSMLLDKLIKEKVINAITVDEVTVAKTIEDLKEQNAKVEEANKLAADGKTAKRAKIEGIKKKLDDGANFAELAKENSDCPSAQRGGDLGQFRRGQMVKPFEDAAFKQEIGKVGDIVETQFGYHLILVTDKQAAQEAKGDEPANPETVTASHILVKFDDGLPVPRPVPTPDEIREQLKSQQSRRAVQAYLKDLKSKAKIETSVPVE